MDRQLREADFADCYADGRGRPSYPAPLLVKALLWGVAQDLSDRDLEQACRYDLRAQCLLGLRVDEPGPDATPFSIFRKHLLAHDQARAAFDAVLQAARDQGLLAAVDTALIDATAGVGGVGD